MASFSLDDIAPVLRWGSLPSLPPTQSTFDTQQALRCLGSSKVFGALKRCVQEVISGRPAQSQNVEDVLQEATRRATP
jgi:hypothetical protein